MFKFQSAQTRQETFKVILLYIKLIVGNTDGIIMFYNFTPT